MPPIRWQPDCVSGPPSSHVPRLFSALGRGRIGFCPACGQGHLFTCFLRIVRECASCHALLEAARADEAPPYFVILLTAHIVIPAMLLTQKFGAPTSFELASIVVPLTLVLALALRCPVKGDVLAVLVTMGLLDGVAGPE